VVARGSFAEFLCEQFAPLGRIILRRMFVKTDQRVAAERR